MGTTRYTTINGRIISQNKNGVYTRLLSDPLGNVIATMDASGVKTNDTTYWPYGEVRTGGVSTVTSLGFCGAWGYYTDASARLYVRARYYRPVLGRWQNVDPLWPGESAYGYVGGKSVSLNDPTGFAPCADCMPALSVKSVGKDVCHFKKRTTAPNLGTYELLAYRCIKVHCAAKGRHQQCELWQQVTIWEVFHGKTKPPVTKEECFTELSCPGQNWYYDAPGYGTARLNEPKAECTTKRPRLFSEKAIKEMVPFKFTIHADVYCQCGDNMTQGQWDFSFELTLKEGKPSCRIIA